MSAAHCALREAPGGDDALMMGRIEDGRFHGRAFRVAWSVCRDDGRAEEAVQEAFASIWRNTAPYDAARGRLDSWLLMLVRYRAIDVARENGRHSRNRADEQQAEHRPAPSVAVDDFIAGDGAAELSKVLGQLPDAQREVITLAFYGQLTHAEIATRLNLPPGTVKGRMRLGLERLRTDLDRSDTSARWHIALSDAFHAGDRELAGRIVSDACEEMPAVSMLDDVLAPAMHNVGALWQSDLITVADEQLAVRTCHELLAGVRGALAVAPTRSRETVLLVPPAQEQHTLGLLMAGEVLNGAGYDTVHVHRGASESALRSALLRHRPAIVALSATMKLPASFSATAAVIHDALPMAQVIVGGATGRTLSPHIPAHYVERLDGLLATVDTLLGPQRGKSPVTHRESAARSDCTRV
jgi:RNA polymerase sigma-70 factor (ECF subfamily)